MQWKDVVDAESAFTEIDYLEVPNPTPMTADRLVDRVLSTSFIASLPDQPRDEVERQVRQLAVSLPATFDYPYISRLWLYQAT